MNTASRRRFLVMVFSLLVMAVASIPSFAGLQWCPGGDPSFLINGQTVQANPMVASQNMSDLQQAGGTTLDVRVAPGTSVVVTKNVGPYKAAINVIYDDSIPVGQVRFTATVPSATSFPVALNVVGGQNPGTAYGTSDAGATYNLVIY